MVYEHLSEKNTFNLISKQMHSDKNSLKQYDFVLQSYEKHIDTDIYVLPYFN